MNWLIVWNEGGRLMPFPATEEAKAIAAEPSARCLPLTAPDRDTAVQVIAVIERYIGELAIQAGVGDGPHL